jgi:hypothetical protein
MISGAIFQRSRSSFPSLGPRAAPGKNLQSHVVGDTFAQRMAVITP